VVTSVGRKMRTAQRSKFGLVIKKNFPTFDRNGLCGHLELLIFGGKGAGRGLLTAWQGILGDLDRQDS